MKTVIVIVLVLAFVQVGDNARILGIIPTPSYSHQVAYQPLWKELSLRGHQVTVLTTDPINDPSLTNLTEIDLSFSYNVVPKRVLEVITNRENAIKGLHALVKGIKDAFQVQVEHPKVQKLLHDPNAGFDLLVVEFILLEPMAFSKIFNCPFIGVISSDLPSFMYKLLGNPTHPVLYPDLMLGEEKDLSLLKRMGSVLYEYVLFPLLSRSALNAQQESVKHYFGRDYDLIKIREEVSLLFVHSEPIFHPVRPINPLIIPIGGHLMRLPSKPLPKDIKDMLDKAQNGFIYFSLGSNANCKNLPRESMNEILETFKELPYTILWKYDDDSFPKKPDNVVISKWLPQLEVLNHPNIKLFITQGGALSIEEAVSARVPMLGMPFLGDQPYNIKKIVNRGCGLELNYKTLEKTKFKETILELINNASYRNQISKLADLAQDQPMTGLERAVWWTEYVLRHNGTKHLRSPASDVPWYQFLLLDVIAVLASILSAFVYICVVLIRKFLNILNYVVKGNTKIKSQ